jgi:hypothetical protein
LVPSARANVRYVTTQESKHVRKKYSPKELVTDFSILYFSGPCSAAGSAGTLSAPLGLNYEAPQ